MNEAERAVAAAMTIECKKDGLRQTQDGLWKLSLTVAELPEGLAMAPMGVRYQAVFVELDDVEEPVKREKPKPPAQQERQDTPEEKAKRHFEASCQDPHFEAWMRANTAISHEAYDNGGEFRETLKAFMGIRSANEFLTDPPIVTLWDEIWTGYKYRDNVQ